MADRAARVFPGGSNGEFDLPAGLNPVIAEAAGCRVRDTAGREYLDMSMGWGSALPGHACGAITKAVAAAARRGINTSHLTDTAVELAEELVRLSPACEQVRLCTSGTEATLYCLRLARAATGRERVVRFEGAYHGAHDVGVTSLFPRGAPAWPAPQASCDGIPAGVLADVLVTPFNDLPRAARLLADHGDSIAAVIVEPLQRCLPPQHGFLAGLRRLCDDHGALLVFDEVVTGFRLAYGGAQEYYGVVPDLVAYGKALGGGCPIGAFGGREEIMALCREARMGHAAYAWTASSTGVNRVSSAAALAALARYREPGTYEHLAEMGRYLREGMVALCATREVTATVIGEGPLAQIVLAHGPVHDHRDMMRADASMTRRMMLGLLERGVFLNPMGSKLYLSLAHDTGDCDTFLERLDDTLAAVQSADPQDA